MRNLEQFEWSSFGAVFVAMSTACSSDAPPEHAPSVKADGQVLTLEVDPAAHLRYRTCDLVQGLDKLSDGTWAPLREDLPGSPNFDG